MHVEITYDGDGDVLYASLGRPVPCTSRDVGDGVLVRYDVMTGEIAAVTLIGVADSARDRRDAVLARLNVLPQRLRDEVIARIDRISR
jgi:uncharacterized protein YuzE